jgi:hypothetical protein
VIRQRFAESCGADGPLTGFTQCLLVLGTYVHFRDILVPSVTAGSALVSKATDVVSFFTVKVTKPWNVYSVGPTAKIILVFIALYDSCRSTTKMVVHEVVSKFTAAAAKSAIPYVGSRIEQHPGGIQ